MIEHSGHKTTVTVPGIRDSGDSIPARKFSSHWLRIKRNGVDAGWVHGAFFVPIYFPKPEKKLKGLPWTTSGECDGKICYGAPDLFIAGCSSDGLLAYMCYPTENPACAGSYFAIVDTATRKTVFAQDYCGDRLDVWDIYSTEINHKLNEYRLKPADFALEKGAVKHGSCRSEFKIKLKRSQAGHIDEPAESWPIKGYSLVQITGGRSRSIADFNSDYSYEKILLGGCIRNPLNNNLIVIVIRVSGGEEFDFIAPDLSCP